MANRILPEEKALRNWVRWATCDLPDAEEKKFAFKIITALIRAVREDCATVCGEAYRNGEDCVQAIRGREK
jgi:hypothetical protein